MAEQKPKEAIPPMPTVKDPKPDEVQTMTFNEKQLKDMQSLLSMNATTLRREVLQKLLNPGKNINYECGYPDTIEISDYKLMYDRNGTANRVVKLMPEESWAMMPEIYETEKPEDTEFEKKWKVLEKEKHLTHYLQRVDILSGIGRFGILLLGINDGKDLNIPVEGIDENTGKATGKGKYELLFLKPFDESIVTIKSKVSDVTSARYGYPLLYTVDFETITTVGATVTISTQKKDVHWTRVIHVADNRDTSEIYGTPRQKSVYNRLLDVRKLLGSSAEMFWKGAYPGYSFEVNPDVSDAVIDTESVRTQFEAYSAGLQRYLALTGVTAKSLEPQVADPKGHLDAQIRSIAITLGIPYRVFLGTEEAKLASSQDIHTWNKRVAKRQESYVSPLLIRVFVDRLIAFGVLPAPKADGEYFIAWPDLNAPSEKDAADIARVRTEAFAKYVAGDVDALIPPKEFLTKIMGMTIEEAEAIEKAVKEYVKSEFKLGVDLTSTEEEPGKSKKPEEIEEE